MEAVPVVNRRVPGALRSAPVKADAAARRGRVPVDPRGRSGQADPGVIFFAPLEGLRSAAAGVPEAPAVACLLRRL